MSELSVQGPGNVAGVSASGLLLSCSALLISSSVSNSHLLFSFLIKLVAFLGPLFVTTFLVLLALFTLSPGFSRGETLGTGPGCVLGAISAVLNKFRSNADEGTRQQLDALEGSEAYRILFEVPDLESGRHGLGIKESEMLPEDKFLIYDDQGVRTSEAMSPHETDGNCLDEEIARPDIESGKKSGALFQEEPCCETGYLDGKELKAKVKVEGKYFEKVDEEKQDFHNNKSDSLWMKASEAKINNGGDDNNNVFVTGGFGDREIVGGKLGGFGSMRKGKEWNRTLACKLMEERQDVEGERMDSLWETYNEDESISSLSLNKDAKHNPKKKKEEEEGEGMTEEEGLFCFLQALRLSAGKMGVLRGIGRKPPANLVKISRAFTLHHLHHVPGHSSTNNHLKHAKKCRN